MNIFSIFLLSFALGADAFTIAVTGGIYSKRNNFINALKMALFFGIFQAIMPILGFLIGNNISFIVNYNKIISFIILLIIGIKMIYESFTKNGKQFSNYFSIKTLFILSIATSLDAFAIGIIFINMQVKIILPVIIIGIITFLMSLIGFFIGNSIGHFFENKVEAVAGVILVLLGIKLLIF